MFYEDGEVAIEFTSPICSVLSRFNRGKAAKLAGTEISSLFYIESYFVKEGIYSPDSTESFKLLDKEIAINDAVDFFESYINNLPRTESESLTNTSVLAVEVLKLDSNSFGYNFLTTTEYNGILFDRTESGVTRRTNEKSEGYNYVISTGAMVQSDEVDYVNGIARSHTVQNETKYDKIISFETAANEVRASLTAEVIFEIQDAGLVYCSKNPDTPYSSLEGVIFHTFPSWKFTLYNQNDNLTYVFYLDAIDGENIRYYTIGKQEW